jgi:hypothetical protein
VVWKLFLIGSTTLLVIKLFFRTRLREWGRLLDRAVNLTLVLLFVSYALYFGWQIFEGAPK